LAPASAWSGGENARARVVASTGGTNVNEGTLVLGNADATAGGAIAVSNGALARVQASLPKAVTVTTPATNTTGKLDLTDNSMGIKGMTGTQVRALLQSGCNAGHWDGAASVVSRRHAHATSDGDGLNQAFAAP
jgi:hypothetical protein